MSISPAPQHVYVCVSIAPRHIDQSHLIRQTSDFRHIGFGKFTTLRDIFDSRTDSIGVIFQADCLFSFVCASEILCLNILGIFIVIQFGRESNEITMSHDFIVTIVRGIKCKMYELLCLCYYSLFCGFM